MSKDKNKEKDEKFSFTPVDTPSSLHAHNPDLVSGEDSDKELRELEAKDKKLQEELEKKEQEEVQRKEKEREEQIKNAEVQQKREEEQAEKNRKAKEEQKKELSEKLAVTIKEFDGESNIPINHDYWNWLTQYRSL
jgi:uncharacterized protein YgiM (DUF1202 family)